MIYIYTAIKFRCSIIQEDIRPLYELYTRKLIANANGLNIFFILYIFIVSFNLFVIFYYFDCIYELLTINEQDNMFKVWQYTILKLFAYTYNFS